MNSACLRAAGLDHAPDLPITLAEPQIGQLVAGALTRLRRTGPLADRIRAGSRLWVREPFHLPAHWGATAPSTAVGRHARPSFTTDLPPAASRDTATCALLGLGKRHFARSLPRAAHRQHLLVTARWREPLQKITEDEARAEGFASRAAWAAGWDRNLAFYATRPSLTWRDNPTVLVIEFVRIPAALPS